MLEYWVGEVPEEEMSKSRNRGDFSLFSIFQYALI